MRAARPLLPSSVWIGLAVVSGLALLWLLRSVLTPFLVAAILAYILYPWVEALTRRKVPPTAASLLVLSVVGIIFLVLLMLIIPLFYRQFAALIERMPALTAWLETQVAPTLSAWFGTEITLDGSRLQALLSGNLGKINQLLLSLLPSLRSSTLSVMGTLANLALIPLVMFYFLRDWPRLTHSAENMLPRRFAARTAGLAREIDRVLGEFLRGQLSVMLVMSIYYSLVLKLVGLQFAFSVGIITGLLVFIPYVGMATGLLLATMAGMLQFDSMAPLLMVWLVFAIGQALEGFVVTPWLVGDRIGLHPVAVLFALMAFGQLFGFTGVLLALPLAACLLVALRQARTRYLNSAFYQQN